MCEEPPSRQRSAHESPEDETASQQKRLASIVREEDGIAKETTHLAEGWISQCATTSAARGSVESARAIMQTAKKLVLVDDFDKKYKRLQGPAEAVAKTGRSLQLSDTLRNSSVADDRKVRQYVAALHRYLNVRKAVPEEPHVEPNFHTYVPPPNAPRRGRRGRRQRWTPY